MPLFSLRSLICFLQVLWHRPLLMRSSVCWCHFLHWNIADCGEKQWFIYRGGQVALQDLCVLVNKLTNHTVNAFIFPFSVITAANVQKSAESRWISILLLVCFNPSARNPSISASQILRAYLWTEVSRVVQASSEGQGKLWGRGEVQGRCFQGHRLSSSPLIVVRCW